MPYTLAAAAKAVDRNKTTVLRAIKRGRISALRDEATGGWLIEPAELHRFYGAAVAPPSAPPDPVAATPDAAPRTADSVAATPDAMVELRARLEATEARLVDSRDQVDDLRRRLDEERADRRLLQQQLGDALSQIRLLTDQRTAPAPARRSWWRWGRR